MCIRDRCQPLQCAAQSLLHAPQSGRQTSQSRPRRGRPKTPHHPQRHAPRSLRLEPETGRKKSLTEHGCYADVEGVEQTATGMRVRALVQGKAMSFEADLIIHGAGRVPAIDTLELDKADVRAGKKGVEVNEYLQSTSNPSVYAAGDVAATAGSPLTPVANLEGQAVATNLLEGNHAKPDYTGIPSAVFTIPALARVGILEDEAREHGLDFTC